MIDRSTIALIYCINVLVIIAIGIIHVRILGAKHPLWPSLLIGLSIMTLIVILTKHFLAGDSYSDGG